MNSLQSLGTHPDFPGCKVIVDGTGDFCLTQPYPSDQTLRDYYQSEYRTVRQEGPTPDYVQFMDKRAAEQVRFITSATGLTQFQRAIDIGCGAGRLVNALAPICKQVDGYEADEAMSQFASENRTGTHVNIRNTLFSPDHTTEPADIITLSHVLEHVPQPSEFLASLRVKALQPGGYLFIEVPNDPPYWVRKQIDWKLRGLGHLNYFTAPSIQRILTAAGLDVIAQRVCGEPLAQLMRGRRPRSRVERFLNRIVRQDCNPPWPAPSYEDATPAVPDRVYLQILATPAQTIAH